MESDKKYTLTVFNTCTREYEEVAVTEEVYRTYYRTGWNIKDNNQRFFDNEIQMSGMISSSRYGSACGGERNPMEQALQR